MKARTCWGYMGCLVAVVLLFAGCEGKELQSSEAAKTAPPAVDPNVQLIAGFEDAEVPQGWSAGDGKLSISEDHATEGKQSLRVRLTKGAYPGVGVQLRGADWSDYDALCFSLYNSGGDRRGTIRIDEVKSAGYGTRYNLEDAAVALTFRKGANEVELPIASMRQGTPESQGIDVTRIREFKIFFGGLDQTLTLHLDNVRLVRAPRTGPDTCVIADFDKVEGKVTAAAAETTTRVEASPTGEGNALRIELPPDANYPGVQVAVPENWLAYDLLAFDLVPARSGAATPGSVTVKIVDGTGRRQTLSATPREGTSTVTLPLEAASFTALGHVTELHLFWGKSDQARVVYLDNVRLVRAKRVNHPTRHSTAAADDPLALDFSDVLVGKNTCYMVTAWIPLADGRVRVARCSSPDKMQKSYSIDAAAFADRDETKSVRVWVTFLDHGVWHWCERDVTLEATGQTKLSYTRADWLGP